MEGFIKFIYSEKAKQFKKVNVKSKWKIFFQILWPSSENLNFKNGFWMVLIQLRNDAIAFVFVDIETLHFKHNEVKIYV